MPPTSAPDRTLHQQRSLFLRDGNASCRLGSVSQLPLCSAVLQSASFEPGMRVEHNLRGKGTVQLCDGLNQVHVTFDSGEYHRYRPNALNMLRHINEERREVLKGTSSMIQDVIRDSLHNQSQDNGASSDALQAT